MFSGSWNLGNVVPSTLQRTHTRTPPRTHTGTHSLHHATHTQAAMSRHSLPEQGRWMRASSVQGRTAWILHSLGLPPITGRFFPPLLLLRVCTPAGLRSRICSRTRAVLFAARQRFGGAPPRADARRRDRDHAFSPVPRGGCCICTADFFFCRNILPTLPPARPPITTSYTYLPKTDQRAHMGRCCLPHLPRLPFTTVVLWFGFANGTAYRLAAACCAPHHTHVFCLRWRPLPAGSTAGHTAARYRTPTPAAHPTPRGGLAQLLPKQCALRHGITTYLTFRQYLLHSI